MPTNTLVHVDDQSDLVEAINRIVWRDAGGAQYPAQVTWANNVNGYILNVDNAHGEHANFGNGVLRVTDAWVSVATGLRVATNNTLRLYDAVDTDYAELQAEASGGLFVGGSGTTSGIVYPGAVGLGLRGRVLTNVTTGAAAVQAHPTLAGPAGWLFIADDGNFTAIYTLEGGGSGTLLLTGGSGGVARWGAGTASAGASHTSVYTSGGVVLIRNETGSTRGYYMLFVTK